MSKLLFNKPIIAFVVLICFFITSLYLLSLIYPKQIVFSSEYIYLLLFPIVYINIILLYIIIQEKVNIFDIFTDSYIFFLIGFDFLIYNIWHIIIINKEAVWLYWYLFLILWIIIETNLFLKKNHNE